MQNVIINALCGASDFDELDALIIEAKENLLIQAKGDDYIKLTSKQGDYTVKLYSKDFKYVEAMSVIDSALDPHSEYVEGVKRKRYVKILDLYREGLLCNKCSDLVYYCEDYSDVCADCMEYIK